MSLLNIIYNLNIKSVIYKMTSIKETNFDEVDGNVFEHYFEGENEETIRRRRMSFSHRRGGRKRHVLPCRDFVQDLDVETEDENENPQEEEENTFEETDTPYVNGQEYEEEENFREETIIEDEEYHEEDEEDEEDDIQYNQDTTLEEDEEDNSELNNVYTNIKHWKNSIKYILFIDDQLQPVYYKTRKELYSRIKKFINIKYKQLKKSNPDLTLNVYKKRTQDPRVGEFYIYSRNCNYIFSYDKLECSIKYNVISEYNSFIELVSFVKTFSV